MNFKAYSIILGRQIKQKFGRFLLASGGIAVGVWAITLTNGLSAGAQSLIQDFVNGQTIAREFEMMKTPKQDTDIFSANGSSAFLPIAQSEMDVLVKENPQLQYLVPSVEMKINIAEENGGNLQKCLIRPDQPQDYSYQQYGETQSSVKECKTVTVASTPLVKLYNDRRAFWKGDKIEEFGPQDIAVCFKCGNNTNLFEAFKNVSKPEDLIGKKIEVTLVEGPTMYPLNRVVDFSRDSSKGIKTAESTITKNNKYEFTIKAVIDDSDSSGFSISSNSGIAAFIPGNTFSTAFQLANPEVDQNTYGYLQASGAVKDYSNLTGILNMLKEKKYLAISAGDFLVKAVPSVFAVVNTLFFIFGMIAVIASIFGIVNVMTISVLERKKEIGILKALGATNKSIFSLFVSESAFLGILGWLMGTLFAMGMGYLIAKGAVAFMNSTPDLKKNLEMFNLTNFNPEFSWGLLFTTLSIALIATVISGLIPSLRAARQNPAEVMRSE